MKYTLTTIIFAFVCIFASAGNCSSATDSLVLELQALPHDSIRDRLLRNLPLTEQESKEHEICFHKLIIKADSLQNICQHHKALLLYEKYNLIQDSLTTSASAEQLEAIKELYHLNQLQWKQGNLKYRRQIIILSGLTIILALSIVYILHINRIRKNLKLLKKETKRATRRAERANAIKNRFLSNMSHAIRVPLNGVLGFSQIIANDTELDDTEREEYAEIIQQNTKQLMSLVNNVLDLSRLEAGMMKFKINEYDIVQLCNDVVETAYAQNDAIHTQFQSNIEQFVIQTDINKIAEMIVSTITYTSDSIKDKRNIIFSLDRKGEILRFKVTNSPLADRNYANQDSVLRNDLNRLLLKHFGGTYQVITESKEGASIIFTYPVNRTQ